MECDLERGSTVEPDEAAEPRNEKTLTPVRLSNEPRNHRRLRFSGNSSSTSVSGKFFSKPVLAPDVINSLLAPASTLEVAGNIHLSQRVPCVRQTLGHTPVDPFITPGHLFAAAGPTVVPGHPFAAPGHPFAAPGHPFAAPGHPFAAPGHPFGNPGHLFIAPRQQFLATKHQTAPGAGKYSTGALTDSLYSQGYQFNHGKNQ